MYVCVIFLILFIYLFIFRTGFTPIVRAKISSQRCASVCAIPRQKTRSVWGPRFMFSFPKLNRSPVISLGGDVGQQITDRGARKANLPAVQFRQAADNVNLKRVSWVTNFKYAATTSHYLHSNVSSKYLSGSFVNKWLLHVSVTWSVICKP